MLLTLRKAVLICIFTFTTLLIFRLSKWWWTAEAFTRSEPEGVPPEGWRALQSRAPPIARGRRSCGRAVPVVASQCRGGESQRAAAHAVPHRGEDDERTGYEVVNNAAIHNQRAGCFSRILLLRKCFSDIDYWTVQTHSMWLFLSPCSEKVECKERLMSANHLFKPLFI